MSQKNKGSYECQLFVLLGVSPYFSTVVNFCSECSNGKIVEINWSVNGVDVLYGYTYLNKYKTCQTFYKPDLKTLNFSPSASYSRKWNENLLNSSKTKIPNKHR